jgi:hypothetical protein
VNQGQKSPIQLLADKIEAGGLEALTPSERWMYALTWLCIETNGGGLHQFFFNSAGQFAADAVLGLDTVSASKSANILRQAIALFPRGHVPTDLEDRRLVMDELPEDVEWDRLSELTQEFWKANENLAQLVEVYVASHRDLFPALQP